MIDFDRLEQLSSLATPGPWGTEYDGVHVGEMVYVQRDDNNSEVCSTYNRHPTEHGHEESQANARFIAAARTALPALLPIVRAAVAYAEAVQARSDAADAHLDQLCAGRTGLPRDAESLSAALDAKQAAADRMTHTQAALLAVVRGVK